MTLITNEIGRGQELMWNERMKELDAQIDELCRKHNEQRHWKDMDSCDCGQPGKWLDKFIQDVRQATIAESADREDEWNRRDILITTTRLLDRLVEPFRSEETPLQWIKDFDEDFEELSAAIYWSEVLYGVLASCLHAASKISWVETKGLWETVACLSWSICADNRTEGCLRREDSPLGDLLCRLTQSPVSGKRVEREAWLDCITAIYDQFCCVIQDQDDDECKHARRWGAPLDRAMKESFDYNATFTLGTSEVSFRIESMLARVAIDDFSTIEDVTSILERIAKLSMTRFHAHMYSSVVTTGRIRSPKEFEERLESFDVVQLDISRHILSVLEALRRKSSSNKKLNRLLESAFLLVDHSYPISWLDDEGNCVDEEYRVYYKYTLITAPSLQTPHFRKLTKHEAEALARALCTPDILPRFRDDLLSHQNSDRYRRYSALQSLLSTNREPGKQLDAGVSEVLKTIELMPARLQTVWSAAEALLQHDGTLEEQVQRLLAHAVDIPSCWGSKWSEVEATLDHWLNERNLTKASLDALARVLVLLQEYEAEHDFSYHLLRLERAVDECSCPD